jgi:hypothetical protein
VRDLIDHLVSEQLQAPTLLRDGAMIDAIGDTDGDRLGRDTAAPVGHSRPLRA